MRLPVILIVLVGAIAIPAGLQADEPQTVVVVDTEHDFLSGRKTIPPSYQIKPCPSIIVDATSFDFDLGPEFHGHVPDTLLVIVLFENVYSVRWPHNDRRVALSVATMIPDGESTPFAGFQSGKTYLLYIGYPGKTPANSAWAWSGDVKVK